MFFISINMLESIYDISEYIVDGILITQEEFSNDNKKKLYGTLFLVLLVTLIIGIIFLFVGKSLWNRYLTKCVTGIKPLESVFQFAGIYILLKILLSR